MPISGVAKMPDDNQLHVVFGTGPLGRAVVRELYARGRRIRAVNRAGKADFPASVEVVAADASDPDQAARACQGASLLYQCAMPPYTQWKEEFPRLQSSIVAAAARVSARLVVADNLYLYGEVEGPIHEDLPAAAETKKGRIRAEMAAALFHAHQQGRVQVTIGRGSDFFGPHVRSAVMGERVFLPAIAGKKATVLGNLDMPHTYTFINDFGRALVTLGEHDNAFGRA
jgi:nucleoside-diphosphate-sugar epimerase